MLLPVPHFMFHQHLSRLNNPPPSSHLLRVSQDISSQFLWQQDIDSSFASQQDRVWHCSSAWQKKEKTTSASLQAIRQSKKAETRHWGSLDPIDPIDPIGDGMIPSHLDGRGSSKVSIIRALLHRIDGAHAAVTLQALAILESGGSVMAEMGENMAKHVSWVR